MFRSANTPSRATLESPFEAVKAASRVKGGAVDAPPGALTGDLAELDEVEAESEVRRRSESTETVEVDVFVRCRGSLGMID